MKKGGIFSAGMEAFENRTLVPEALGPFIAAQERIFFPRRPSSSSPNFTSLPRAPEAQLSKNL